MVSKIKPEIIILLLWFPERLINEDKRLWWWKQSRFPRLLRPLICNRLSKERNVLRSVAQDWHWVVGRMSGMPLTWNRGMEWGMCRTAWAEIHCWTVAKQRNEGRMQLTCPMSKCGRRSIKPEIVSAGSHTDTNWCREYTTSPTTCRQSRRTTEDRRRAGRTSEPADRPVHRCEARLLSLQQSQTNRGRESRAERVWTMDLHTYTTWHWPKEKNLHGDEEVKKRHERKWKLQ